MCEALLAQNNSPCVKYQNPDAWTAPRETKYDNPCARLNFLLSDRSQQLKGVIRQRYALF